MRQFLITRFALVIFLSLLIFGLTKEIAYAVGDANPAAPIAVVDEVKVKGGSTLKDRERAALSDQLRGETTHADWVERLEGKAIRFLHDCGFVDAKVTAQPEPSTTEASHWKVLLTVSEGARYSIANLWWSGSSSLSLKTLEEFSAVHKGDTFSVAALSKTSSDLRRILREQGFAEAIVDIQFREFPDLATADLFFTVLEGHKNDQFQPMNCKPIDPEKLVNLPFQPSTKYNSKRDAQLDLLLGKMEAQRTGRRVFVFVGGTWCPACIALERTFSNNQALLDSLQSKFVVVHIDTEEVNSGCTLKEDLSDPSRFPTVYVIDPKRKSVVAHDPADWELLEGYNPRLIKEFLDRS